jgi:hypothetical protein
MQHADRVREIEGVVPERKRENIGLEQVHVGACADVAVRRIYGDCQIDAEYLRAFGRCSIGESAGADSGIEQTASAKLAVAPAGRASERVLRLRGLIDRIHLHRSEPVPLVAEALRIGVLRDESGHAFRDGIDLRALRAGQRAFDDFRAILRA